MAREQVILLDAAKILAQIQQSASEDLQLLVLDSVDSTNAYLCEHVDAPVAACVAELQSAGRARLQRQWRAPPYQSVILSLRYLFSVPINELSALGLVVGLAVMTVLQGMGISGLQLKWPNDVLHAGYKLAGILLEVAPSDPAGCSIVMGIGINVNTALSEGGVDIDRAWTSLTQITGQVYDRNIIVAALIQQLLLDLKQYALQGFAAFEQRWRCFDSLYQQRVTVVAGDSRFSGTATGVDQQGCLLVRMDTGEVRRCAAGEVSLTSNK